jgi:hypothetical protein
MVEAKNANSEWKLEDFAFGISLGEGKHEAELPR